MIDFAECVVAKPAMHRDESTEDVLAKRVRELRERAGWSQEELGDRVELSQAAVSKIEVGPNLRPRKSTLAQLAKVFGVSVDVLTGEEPLPPPERRRVNIDVEADFTDPMRAYGATSAQLRASGGRVDTIDAQPMELELAVLSLLMSTGRIATATDQRALITAQRVARVAVQAGGEAFADCNPATVAEMIFHGAREVVERNQSATPEAVFAWAIAHAAKQADAARERAGLTVHHFAGHGKHADPAKAKDEDVMVVRVTHHGTGRDEAPPATPGAAAAHDVDVAREVSTSVPNPNYRGAPGGAGTPGGPLALRTRMKDGPTQKG